MTTRGQAIRQAFLVPCLAGMLFCGTLLNAGQRGREETTPNTFPEAFEKIQKRVRENFYDSKLHGLNWEATAARYRDKAGAATSRREFAKTVNAMLAELHASHAEFMTDSEFGYYLFSSVISGDIEGKQATHIGVMGEYEEDVYRVSGVLEEGPAALAGMQVGDRLLRVDGEPFSSIGAFRGKEGKAVEVTLLREGTGEKNLRIIPRRENMLKAFLEATKRSAKVTVKENRRIGYVHLWTMGHESFREALEGLVLGKLFETDGLILDLRDGFGGMPWGYSRVFFDPEVEWEQSTRFGKNVRRAGYGKPIVVLINNGTRSAKEFFAYQFKKAGRAKLVGSPTKGAFLGAGAFAITSWGLLELPIVGLRVDGQRLEGKGIEPDVRVEPKDTYQETDRQQRRAEEVLIGLIKGRSSKRIVY